MAAVLALLLGMVAYLSGGAEAVHDEGFALQGDVDHASLLDWVDLFDVSGTNQPTPKATLPGDFVRASFDQDFQEPDATAYATGSKDTLPINLAGAGDWQCKSSNNIGDKFNLLNAYAAALRPSAGDAAGDLIVYFGSEISAPEGNRNAGLWLLQDESVDCSSSGGGNQNWTGHHTDGDVFVVSAFTNGGTQANVTVYEWVDAVGAPDDDIGGSLQLRFGIPSNQAPNDFLCVPPGQTQPHDDVACAITNSTATVNTPWVSPDKSGGDLDIHTFLEGAVNLSDLGLDACFSTAVHNSRSSQEAGSTLHDFSRMQFETCGNLSVHKYIDADMSGTNNTGDVDGPGWSFVVENSDGDVVCEGETDAAGDLVCDTGSLENLPTGTYTVTETQNTGFFNTDPGDDGDPTTTPNFNPGATVSKTVTISLGDASVEFGNTCYVDKTFRITGVPTGATAPSSITVRYSVNGGATTDLNLAATANASIWEGVVNDTLIQTDSLTWSWFINGNAANSISEGTESLASGAYPTCAVLNTGTFPLTTLNGTKFKDADADGVRDAGEPGLGGFTFTLTRNSDSAVIATTQSAADGTYSFSNVPPGQYTVSEGSVTGWAQTAPAGGTAAVTVALGQASVTIAAFGNTPLSTITVTFNPLTSPAATHATAISCVDSDGASVGGNTGSNSLTTNNVDVSQSAVVCTITYVDP